MTYVYSSGNPPSFYLEAGAALEEGDVIKLSGATIIATSVKGDEAIGVVLEGAASGAQCEYAMQGVVNVKSSASQTWAHGALVYLHATDDGLVVTAADTSTCIGRYVGKALVTTATDGDLIPVLIDLAQVKESV